MIDESLTRQQHSRNNQGMKSAVPLMATGGWHQK